ncbi:MAG: DUF3887 domain-containing protein [Solirubrobacteraceae bacterium]
MALVLERNVEIVLGALRDPARGLAAVTAAVTVGDTVDEVIQALVQDARGAGHTWHEIGEVLAISRQAAQQRFGRPATPEDPEDLRIARRAVDLIEQLSQHDWEGASGDWDETMRAKLPVDELASTWQQIVANAGDVTAIGRPSIVGRGPYRVCDVPIVFEHGPMRARVSFNRAGSVSGLFITLPE